MINRDSLKWQILADGLDDFIGLYEIIWHLNTIYPHKNLGFKYDAAEDALNEFLENDWVRLYRTISPWALVKVPEHDPSKLEEIPSADIHKTLANPVSWYPCDSDNNLIGYLTTEAGRAALAALGGTEKKKLTELPNQKIAFCAMVNLKPDDYPPDFRFRIYVVDADGSNLKRVDHLGDAGPPDAVALDPKWCPDGQHLEYSVDSSSQSGNKRHRFRVSLLNGEVTQIEDPLPPDPLYKHWESPDGKHAFLLWDPDDSPTGFVISRADGSGEKHYAKKLHNVSNASWLPDSSAILFHAHAEEPLDRAVPAELRLYERKKNQTTHLLDWVICDDINVWSPDLQLLLTEGRYE